MNTNIKIMKGLLILIALSSCDQGNLAHYDTSRYFVHEKFVIEDKGTKSYTHFFMLRSVSHPDSVCQYNGLGNHVINEDKFYNAKLGDTLYFDYINKDRFFFSQRHNKKEDINTDKILDLIDDNIQRLQQLRDSLTNH